jgi:hypothetical protein
MTAPQLHLMLNHVPVIGTLFVALTLAAGLLFRSAALLRFGMVMLVGVALAAAPVFFSGEPAEESIEHMAGVSEPSIEAHEDMAKTASIALGALGLLAIAGLLFARGGAPSRGLATATLVFALAVGGAMAWTAHLGGGIRHPEIRGAGTEPGLAGERESGGDHD